jgi:excisionase family DNA binding protein
LTEEEREAADPWLTLAEIASELRVNPATVRQWVSKGQLKASRAGVRKWIVRRSDLERMLAETNLTPDEVLEQLENSRGPARESAPPPRRPETDDRPEAADTRPPARARSPREEGAVELLRQAIVGFDRALTDSAYAAPSPGYVDRIRAVADSCEHVAATMLNASAAAGVRWRSKPDLADALSYELRPDGNRPGRAEIWEEFDAAFDRLAITATGTDIVAVGHGFREVWDALRTVADELESDANWQAWERQAR